MSIEKKPTFHVDHEKCEVSYNKSENTISVDLVLVKISNTNKNKRFVRTLEIFDWLEKEWIPANHPSLKIINTIKPDTAANHCADDNLKGLWIFDVESKKTEKKLGIKKDIPKLIPKTKTYNKTRKAK